MVSIEDAAEQRGKAEGKAEMFLLFARQKFAQIPDHCEQQVRSATPSLVEIWANRLPEAADLESVFNGGD